MKYYEDFKRTGYSYAERVGEPNELDAALGAIASSFTYLEDTARNVIIVLSRLSLEVGHILTARMSFRQKLDVLAPLTEYLASLNTSSDAQCDLEARLEATRELLVLCSRAEELRNTYLHSSYGYRERAKLSAGGRNRIRFVREAVDGALLLDVSDYIQYVGSELEALPLTMAIVDFISIRNDCVSYSKDGAVVAAFRFGEVD